MMSPASALWTGSAGPMSSVQWAALTGLVLLFLTLAFSVWDIHQSPNQPRKGLNIVARTDKAEYFLWPPLEQEKLLYRQNHYDLDWMTSGAMLTGRKLFGPYAALVELVFLRLFGLAKVFPIILIAALFGFAEGRIAACEKKYSFRNISATRYKLAMIANCCALAISILFITLPFGADLPFIGAFPLTIGSIWMTSPHLWGVLLAFVSGVTMFQIFSNLSLEV